MPQEAALQQTAPQEATASEPRPEEAAPQKGAGLLLFRSAQRFLILCVKSVRVMSYSYGLFPVLPCGFLQVPYALLCLDLLIRLFMFWLWSDIHPYAKLRKFIFHGWVLFS